MKFIKKYYKLGIVLLVLFIILMTFLGSDKIKIDGMSSDNVYNTIKELSSVKYKGRRYGTPENMEAVKYIEEQFKSIGLKPGGENGTYLREYGAIARSYNGVAELEVLDSQGSLVKKYKYGDDFIELGYGYSISGELTSGFEFIDYKLDDSIPDADENDLIAVASVDKKDVSTMIKLGTELKRAGYNGAAVVVPNDVDLRRESASTTGASLHKSGYEMPWLIIKENMAKELKAYKEEGDILHIKSTFTPVAAALADVMGMIPGTGRDYLFITAHLDHIGPGSDGTIYPGALDNASGVGTMLEIARYIKSQGKTPSKNIVFIAFNGEEGDLIGSMTYVSGPLYPLYNTTVINLDMIGANKDIPLTLMHSVTYRYSKNSIDTSSKMVYHLKNMAGKIGIPVNEVNERISDHYPFNAQGVPAVTLIDYDKTNIHTPLDNMDNIDKKNIDRTLKLVMGYISLSAFLNLSAWGYSMSFQETMNFLQAVYPILIMFILLSLLFYLYYRKKKAGKPSRRGRMPVLAIILIILASGLVGYMPLKYPYVPSKGFVSLNLLIQGIYSILKGLIYVPMFTGFMLPGLIALFIIKQNMGRWDYRGSGREMDIAHYLSILSVILISFILPFSFDKPIYLPVTPDFARHLLGKILLYLFIACVSYIIYRIMCLEAGMKRKGFAKFFAFSIIFFILLSSFYMPITTNRYIMDIRYTQSGSNNE